MNIMLLSILVVCLLIAIFYLVLLIILAINPKRVSPKFIPYGSLFRVCPQSRFSLELAA